MNYVLRSKAQLLFAAKHGPEDRLRVKPSMLERGSDADLITHNLSSVAVIWSALQNFSLDLKLLETPLCLQGVV